MSTTWPEIYPSIVIAIAQEHRRAAGTQALHLVAGTQTQIATQAAEEALAVALKSPSQVGKQAI